jgi:hypothetical protein
VESQLPATTLDSAGSQRTWLKRWPRGVATIILAIAAYFSLFAPGTNDCTLTTRTTTNADSSAVDETRTCGPITRPGAAEILPLVAIALLFLLSEFSEVSVPGLLSLKREVSKQASTLARQEAKQEELQKWVLNTIQNQSVNVSNVVDTRYQSPTVIEEQTQGKVQSERQGESGEVELEGDQASEDQLDILKYRLLRDYGQISPYVAVATAPSQDSLALRPSAAADIAATISFEQRQALRDWYRHFRRELEAVRAVRNSIAHPPSLVSVEDLKATISTISLLKVEAERAIGNSSS